jgi:hypothetical protein
MSATLYALVVLQGSSLTFAPGYTSAAECLQQYKGPNVACFAYDGAGTTWTAFFKLPNGGFRNVGKIVSEDECKRYIGAFKDDIPAACRQLATPTICNVACVAPVQPPAPTGSIPNPVPSKPPEVTPQAVPPDPASLAPTDTKPSDIPPGATAIQVGGKQYTKVAGLTWVERESTKPDTFADVSVGPNDLQSKDKPSLPPKTDTRRVAAAKLNSLVQGYNHAPQPVQGFIDVVMLPWDFLAHPARRDW